MSISPIPAAPVRRHRWFDRLMALIAVFNFILVLFNLSYIPWRDFYFHEVPELTQFYDPYKGIEPHRETQYYLTRVDALFSQVLQTGVASEEVEVWLEELRFLSDRMIEDNPFALASKSGTLEKIKNHLRDRLHEQSAHIAFEKFWSQEHLQQAGWESEFNFFNTEIRPLIEINYYRKIDINGHFIDRFWQIDLPFILLFSLEFLSRTFYLSRVRSHLSWLDAMVRRWYDIPLLLPVWQQLRILPIIIRLHQSGLINLDRVRIQVNHDIVVGFAEELTEVVGVQMIDQMQDTVRRGDLLRWLLRPETRRPYININNRNEVSAIAKRLVNLSIYQVFPQIQPDLEALIQHSIRSTLNQSSAYQQLQSIPGLNRLPEQLTENVAKNLCKTSYDMLTAGLKDPELAELNRRLAKNFGKALEAELEKRQNRDEIQSLLIDLLEEIKINYVKNLTVGGLERSLEESEKLRQLIER